MFWNGYYCFSCRILWSLLQLAFPADKLSVCGNLLQKPLQNPWIYPLPPTTAICNCKATTADQSQENCECIAQSSPSNTTFEKKVWKKKKITPKRNKNGWPQLFKHLLRQNYESGRETLGESKKLHRTVIKGIMRDVVRDLIKVRTVLPWTRIRKERWVLAKILNSLIQFLNQL